MKQFDTNQYYRMGSFTDRKTLMRCIEQLKEKVVVDQHYSHLKEVRQECFDYNKFCWILSFQHDLTAHFGSRH